MARLDVPCLLLDVSCLLLDLPVGDGNVEGEWQLGENGVKQTDGERDRRSVRPMAGCGEKNVMSVRVFSIIYFESKDGSGPRRGTGWASGNIGGPLKRPKALSTSRLA